MLKPLFLAVSVISILLLTISITSAQDTANSLSVTWPVEERCISAPTKPPRDWNYDGTILMTGYAGIHGVNAEWDTPRVLAKLGENDLWGGALSPDGKWYASPFGTRETTESYNTITETQGIHIYSLNGAASPIVIEPLVATTFQQTHGYVYWQSNKQFMFGADEGTKLVDVDTKKMSDWDQMDDFYDGDDNRRLSFSPDWSRVVYYQHIQSETGISFAKLRNLIDKTEVRN